MRVRVLFRVMCWLMFGSLPVVFSGCGEPRRNSVDVVAGVPPVAELAQRVAGPEVTVRSALPVGRSPHDFSPRPGDVRDIAGSRMFLHTGMPFERSVLRALDGGKVKIVDVTHGITRIPLEAGGCAEHHHADDADDHAHGDEDALDPHVWLSPENCMMIARNIAAALTEAMPERRAEFERNLETVLAELKAADTEMKEKLAPYRGRIFFVHHPAFGYFAAASGVRQHGIELGGREPSPARLAEIIHAARDHQVKTIFVQPQFNPAAARSLATAIDGEAVELDPLAPDIIANFHRLTDHIERGFRSHAQ